MGLVVIKYHAWSVLDMKLEVRSISSEVLVEMDDNSRLWTN